MVRDVELVVLHFVVGSPVCAGAEGVVASPVFVAVSHDGAGDGGRVAEVVGIVAIGGVRVVVVGGVGTCAGTCIGALGFVS